MTGTFNAVVRRDLLLAARQRADVANTLLFFLVVVTMVPLGGGPEINTLRTIAPGVVWVAALLAAILSLNRMFAADFADGSLEQMVLSGEPLPVVVLAKVLAHWLTTGLPITVMAVLLGVMFDLPRDAIAVLVASLLLGTPALSLIGAVGAALTLGLRGGGVLITAYMEPRAEFILGRKVGTTSELLLDLSPFAGYSLGVSRRHVSVRRAENGYEILDLGSVNGTWLNEERLMPHQFYPLPSGSHLRLGRMRLLVLYQPFVENTSKR